MVEAFVGVKALGSEDVKWSAVKAEQQSEETVEGARETENDERKKRCPKS